MLIAADWVLPVSGAPIREGAVLTRGNRIEAVGTLSDLEPAPGREKVHVFEGCVIAPGLVNAHTHLSLTCMSGLIPEQPFNRWVRKLVRAMRALDDDDYAASAAWGGLECLKSGTTVVGDIAYGPEASAAVADIGMGGVFFWEVLGISPGELAETLAEIEFPSRSTRFSGRTAYGISPHSAYTSGPMLLKAVHRLAAEAGIGFCLHAAESPEEAQLMAGAGGALEEIAVRSALGFRPPHSGTIEYLDRLGVLSGTLLVHAVQLRRGEAQTIAEKAKGVVLCPRSNAYLQNGRPPAADLVRAGAVVALGTDSAASNDSLDLMDEARALAAIDKALSPDRLLRMLTLDGAKALGMEKLFGSLEPGKEADLVVMETGGTEDPVAAFIEKGGAGSVRAVLSSGIWRVNEGKTSIMPRGLEAGYEVAVEKAAREVTAS